MNQVFSSSLKFSTQLTLVCLIFSLATIVTSIAKTLPNMSTLFFLVLHLVQYWLDIVNRTRHTKRSTQVTIVAIAVECPITNGTIHIFHITSFFFEQGMCPFKKFVPGGQHTNTKVFPSNTLHYRIYSL